MTLVGLGPLHDPFQPAWGAHVHVLDQLGDGSIESDQCGCRGMQAQDADEQTDLQEGLRNDVERVRDGETHDIDPLRAVMQLVQRAPHDIETMLAAVVPVVEKAPGHEAHGESAGYAESHARQQAVLRNPLAGDEQRQHHGDRAAYDEEDDAEEAPAADLGLCFARQQRFDDECEDKGAHDDGADSVFYFHGALPTADGYGSSHWTVRRGGLFLPERLAPDALHGHPY